jgi:DNA-binding transcriptional regulator YiaG
VQGRPPRLACEMPDVTTGPMVEDEAIDINRLRRRLDMTQEELAAALGVTVGTVNRWENGHFRPSRLAEKALKNLLAQVKKSGPDGGRG